MNECDETGGSKYLSDCETEAKSEWSAGLSIYDLGNWMMMMKCCYL